MPVMPCRFGNRPGFRWGEEGKCYTYTPGDEASKQRAHNKAAEQGRAVKASQGRAAGTQGGGGGQGGYG